MIKKIICPTDFSKAAVNASEYAAKIAQLFSAELLFVNVQRVLPVGAELSFSGGVSDGVRKNSRDVAERLREMSVEANMMFNITTDYEVDITTKSLKKIISSLGTDNSMIVMGTNGADDMFQYFFGSNTYQVIKKSSCPVLVVPENISYGSIKKIVFAWDYTSKNKISFSILNDLSTAYNPQFIFIHVSKHRTEISKELFKTVRDEIESVLGEDNDAEFEQIFSDNIPESLNAYMIKSKADLLSITFYDRGIMSNIFHGAAAKKLSEKLEYPVLVLHA